MHTRQPATIRIGMRSSLSFTTTGIPPFLGITCIRLTHGLSEMEYMILTSINFTVYFFYHLLHVGIQSSMRLHHWFVPFFQVNLVRAIRGTNALDASEFPRNSIFFVFLKPQLSFLCPWALDQLQL